MPSGMIERLQRSRRCFFAVDVVSQAKAALFDQRLFGPNPTQQSPEDLRQAIEAAYPVSNAPLRTQCGGSPTEAQHCRRSC